MSLAAEQFALGAILVASPQWSEVEPLAKRSDFTDPRHRHIWDAMEECGLTGVAIDLSTVVGALQHGNALESAGGAGYVASLTDGVAKSGRWRDYLKPVRAAARERLRKALSEDLATCEERETRAALVEKIIKLDAPEETLIIENLATILATPPEEAPWAVEGLLAEGDLAILSGPGGVHKTWISLAMMLSMARGGRLFDYYDITKPHNVAFLDLETRPWEVKLRLHRLSAGMGITPTDPVCKNTNIIQERARLNNREDMARIEESLLRWGTKFLFVDSYRRFNSGDENESTANNALYELLDTLRFRTGCGFVVIDHHRKRSGDKELDTADQALRGSGAKRDMLDNHIAISNYNDNILFEPEKGRHGKKQVPIVLSIEGLTDDYRDVGPVYFRFVGHKDKASDKVQDALLALLTELDREVSKAEAANRTGYSISAVEKAGRELKKRGLVNSRIGEKTQAFYALAQRG